jgi:hypothetical protein
MNIKKFKKLKKQFNSLNKEYKDIVEEIFYTYCYTCRQCISFKTYIRENFEDLLDTEYEMFLGNILSTHKYFKLLPLRCNLFSLQLELILLASPKEIRYFFINILELIQKHKLPYRNNMEDRDKIILISILLFKIITNGEFKNV